MKPARARVLMASSVHRWNDGRIYYKEALSLAKVADIHLVAVQAQGALPLPDGRIHVQMLPANGLRPGERKSVALRLKRISLVMRSVLQSKYDVFHFHDPELIPAGWLAKLRGKRVIYDMHEDASKVLLGRKWIPQTLARPIGLLFRMIERVSLPFFDAFILASAGFKRSFKSQKCRTILNYPLNGSIAPPRKQEAGEPLKLVYTGDITTARGATDMLEVVSALQQAGENITLDLFGPVSEHVLKPQIMSASEHGWITHHGWVSLPQLLAKLPDYHVGLSPLHDYPNYRYAWPTKVLEYIAAGLAVVATGLPGTSQLIKEMGCGVLYPPGNLDAFKKAIITLSDEDERISLVLSGRRKIGQYSWTTQEQALFQLYSEILGEAA